MTKRLERARVGLHLNSWEVIQSPYTKKGKKNLYVKCKCRCGKIIELKHSDLLQQRRKACNNCAQLDRRTVKIGEFYGHWRVLEEAKKGRVLKWKCLCKCGNISTLTSYELTSGISPNCKKCSKIFPNKVDFTIWKILVNSAVLRDLEIAIDMLYIKELYDKQEGKCALSGIPLYFATTVDQIKRGMHTVSVDRIDSKKGYLRDNVQLLHKDINMMKNNHDDFDFIRLCNSVAEQHSISDTFIGHGMHCNNVRIPTKIYGTGCSTLLNIGK